MAFWNRKKKEQEMAAREASAEETSAEEIPEQAEAADAETPAEVTPERSDHAETEAPIEEPAEEDQAPVDTNEEDASLEEPAAEVPDSGDEAEEPEGEMIENEESEGETIENEGPEDEKPEAPAEPKQGFFSRLFSGLSKTRSQITGSLNRLFMSYDRIDDDFYDELEEIMVMGDMGIRTTDEILDGLRERVAEERIKDPMACRQILVDSIKEKMAVNETDYAFEHEPSVILMIGVNGTGKTTSAGKLASILKAQGLRVILAAADTFRAAACEQLREWANRAGVEIIAGQEGADPASVVYDAVAAAKARRADVLICDTAGRLHNKKNLMDELSKIYRIVGREYPDAHLETLLVLDGTTGQNALVQAKDFSEAADVTGIILTKLDGTAKGGIAVAIQSELQVPVKYIGVGETLEDLQKFDPDSFVDALFAERADEADE